LKRLGLIKRSSSATSRPGLRHRYRDGNARSGDNVSAAIVPGAGHWLIEENPDATVRLVNSFIEGK